MLTKNSKEWLLVFMLPLIIASGVVTIISRHASALTLPFWLPLGGTVGTIIGFSDAPIYNSANFKLKFLLSLVIALLLAGWGIKYRHKLWGKILVATGVYLWCITGFVALAMSA